MTDQIGIAHRLNAHYADQRTLRLITPERDPGGDLAVELTQRHVRLVPTIFGDYTAISLGGGIDDPQDCCALVITARSDSAHGGILRLRSTLSICSGSYALPGSTTTRNTSQRAFCDFWIASSGTRTTRSTNC